MSEESEQTMTGSDPEVIVHSPEKDKTNEESNSSAKKTGTAEPETGPMNLEDLTDNTEELADNGLPKKVKTKPCKGRGAVWGFFKELVRHIVKEVDRGSSLNNNPSKFKITTRVEKKNTHVCLLCLEDHQSLEDPHPQGWTKSLLKLNNTSNAEAHLRAKHKEHGQVKEFLAKKKEKRASTGALD